MLGGISTNVHCTYDVNSGSSDFKPFIDKDSPTQIFAQRHRPIGSLSFDIKLEDSNPKLGSRSVFSISPNFTGDLINYRIDIIFIPSISIA